MIELMKQVTI
jgi:hypothetical protein